MKKRSMRREDANDVKVQQLDGDELSAFGSDDVYEVDDPDTKQGVYYVVLDTDGDEGSVTVTSLSADGQPDADDLGDITAQVKDRQPDSDDETGVTYKGDVDDVLTDLVGKDNADMMLGKSLDKSDEDKAQQESRKRRAKLSRMEALVIARKSFKESRRHRRVEASLGVDAENDRGDKSQFNADDKLKGAPDLKVASELEERIRRRVQSDIRRTVESIRRRK